MKWLERLIWAGIGALLISALLWIAGPPKVTDEFVANVAGATIGGMIAVGLAILMFQHQRKIAALDATRTAESSRMEAIREALRYVRAIRECIFGARGITINSSQRILESIHKARLLTLRALEDQNLTDFPLRLSMEDSAKIAGETAARLEYDLQQANMQEANQPAPGAGEICDLALVHIDQLIADYTKIRSLPSIQDD